jgi:hypothetical protein
MGPSLYDNGGPAFPVPATPSDPEDFDSGMSLRDYFAARALPKYLEEFWGEEDGVMHAAEGAYQMADAMLKASEKERL